MPKPPRRIVSVVPSQTELLFTLGLDAEVVGLTKFCIHPADRVRTKTVVGGTKTLDLARIDALQPDLILANKEENTRAQIEELQERYPVHVTDMITLPDALAMIRTVGALVGRADAAHALAGQLARDLVPPVVTALRVAYLIWRRPYMAAASQTFIDAMLHAAGFQNAFADRERYPVLTADELTAARPDLVFLSSEPYPFASRHRAELAACCPDARVLLVDGELFSWYGSRLLHAAPYFHRLHQQLAN
ncbi:helical backbone metal receptor [Spirosoma luteolum]